MKTPIITLTPLTHDDREQFILDNQYAFKFGAVEEFGLRDDHFDDDGEIISREAIARSIDHGVAYRIRLDGKIVGGLVLKIDEKTQRNKLYPETDVWETCTPYFEKRNIHFYINKCGFRAVEFFCEFHRDPNESGGRDDEGPDEMFRFEKRMK